MPSQSFYHVRNAGLLNSFRPREDGFQCFPFVLETEENIAALDAAPNVTKFEKDSFYVQLLQGMDWLVGQHRVDVLNMSLGLKSNRFSPEDPIHIATRHAVDSKIIVVTAAGNRGPGNDSLQAVARAPWVISVGATDEDRKLLGVSARGVPKQCAPTIVSNGVSGYVDPNPKGPKFLPSTSFACARISAVSAFVKVMVRHVASYLEAAINGELGSMSPPVYFLKIGFADTGAPENFQDWVHPLVRQYIDAGKNGFQIAHGADTIDCIGEVISFLHENNQQIRLIVEPETIRNFLSAMAVQIEDYQPYQIGAGYVDESVAVDFWSGFTPQTLLEILLPDVKPTIRSFFREERRFFNRETVEFLFDVTRRGLQVHAKVV